MTVATTPNKALHVTGAAFRFCAISSPTRGPGT